MSLWDAEAAGNAAIYLRLSDNELLEKRNAPYSGRAAVWVPNAATGYCMADVLKDGVKKGSKLCKREDGKEKEYDVS